MQHSDLTHHSSLSLSLKAGTPEEKASDSAYGLKMMTMLAGYGGGLMHLGVKAHSVQPAAEAGEFDSIAAVHYPNGKFFSKLLHSAWMHKTVQGKKPGDSLAVLTVPFGVLVAGRDLFQNQANQKAK
jgi:hypothetical protein